MSSTRHISEQDLIGSPSIEVAREGNLLSPGGIQTEAKERHDGMQLRADRGSDGQGLPCHSRHDEDDAQCESRRDIPTHDPRGPQEVPDVSPRSRPAIRQTGQHLLRKRGGWSVAFDAGEQSNRLLMRVEGAAVFGEYEQRRELLVLVGGKRPFQLSLEQLFKSRHRRAPSRSRILRSISRPRKARTLAAPAAMANTRPIS